MKVILINSPLFRETNLLYEEDSLPPVGLGYICTHLLRHGIDVSLIDAVDQRISLKDLVDKLIKSKPDFVGVNIFTTNYELVKELIEALHFPTHIVVGGLSTKQLFKEIITWQTTNPIDIITGDGEWIMLDIVNGCVKDKPFKEEANRRVFQVDQSSNYFVREISDVPLDRSFFFERTGETSFRFCRSKHRGKPGLCLQLHLLRSSTVPQ